MSMVFYRLKCLTELHMGSGEADYSVVDMEVERDPVTGEPTMNASGVKGALRDACEAAGISDQEIERAFGSKKNGDIPGTYVFFAGDLLARPVRVSGGSGSYALAASTELLKHFAEKLKAFGVGGYDAVLALADNSVCWNAPGVSEAEGVRALQKTSISPEAKQAITALLGTENWILMEPAALGRIDLPVAAHNVLDENGISNNLWYEENVPHESVFGLLVRTDGNGNILDYLGEDPVVQFGAGKSTGSGFVRMQKVSG